VGGRSKWVASLEAMIRILSPWAALAASAAFFDHSPPDHVVGRAGEDVHGDGVEELSGSALQEEDIVGIGDVEQLPAAGDRLVQHRVELLTPVAALGDPEALALVVDQRLGRGLEHLERKHRGPGGEVENAFGHVKCLLYVVRRSGLGKSSRSIIHSSPA
jgi:hypothetical protein